MRKAAIVAMAIVAVVTLAGLVSASDATGKVISVEGDKVAIQIAKGDGANFPPGTKGVEIRSEDGASVRGRVVSSTGDKVTFRIIKGKASSLAAGASVTLDKPKRAASEEMQGC